MHHSICTIYTFLTFWTSAGQRLDDIDKCSWPVNIDLIVCWCLGGFDCLVSTCIEKTRNQFQKLLRLLNSIEAFSHINGWRKGKEIFSATTSTTTLRFTIYSYIYNIEKNLSKFYNKILIPSIYLFHPNNSSAAIQSSEPAW